MVIGWGGWRVLSGEGACALDGQAICLGEMDVQRKERAILCPVREMNKKFSQRARSPPEM